MYYMTIYTDIIKLRHEFYAEWQQFAQHLYLYL